MRLRALGLMSSAMLLTTAATTAQSDPLLTQVGEVSLRPMPESMTQPLVGPFLAGDAAAVVQLVGCDPSDISVTATANFDFSPYVAMAESGEEPSDTELAALLAWFENDMLAMWAIGAPGVDADDLLDAMMAVGDTSEVQEAAIANRRFVYKEGNAENGFAWMLIYPRDDVLYVAASKTEDPSLLEALAASTVARAVRPLTR